MAIVAIMMLFTETSEQEKGSLFGDLALKEPTNRANEGQKSNYHAIRDKNKQAASRKLRYKERTRQENPFFSFYRETQEKPTNKPKQAAGKVQQPQGFFTSYDSDQQQEQRFFEAVFRESQQVEEGKPLRILLQEPIPALQLESGTILKGLPYLAGTRIGIRITAAVTSSQVRPVSLVCFDKEDCVAGLYHDEVATKLEHGMENILLDELWDLDREELSGRAGKMAQRGSRVLRRLAWLNRNNVKIIIPQGRAVFVALPEIAQ